MYLLFIKLMEYIYRKYKLRIVAEMCVSEINNKKPSANNITATGVPYVFS